MTLRERRQRAGMTIAKLATVSGVSASMLSMVERGERGLSHRTARKLAEVLGLKQWWRLCEGPVARGGRTSG